MSKVRLTGATSGFTELTAPAVAGSNTITLPTGNGSANQLLKNGATAGSLEFASNVVIDSSDRLLVGTSTSYATRNYLNNALEPQKQLHGITSASSTAAITNWSNATQGPAQLVLAKSKGTALGTRGIVANNDDIGVIAFTADDGANFIPAASILAEVDGTPGTNDMPGRLVFSTTADGASSPTERARLNSAGLSLAGYVQTSRIQNVEANEAIVLEPSDDSIQFISNGIERMRLIASGDLLVGTTTVLSPATDTDEGCRISPNVIIVSRSGSVPLFLQRTTSNGAIASFYRQTTQVGTISVTTTATAYNTSSDYRLKENVVPLDGAITRLNQLPVHRFNFIADPDTVVDGFIAHEVQDIVPEAITGEKDAVDDEGNPEYQGIDQSKIVPLLTAALQEALQQIEALTARVTALEAN